MYVRINLDKSAKGFGLVTSATCRVVVGQDDPMMLKKPDNSKQQTR